MYEHLTIEAATKHILEEGFASWKRWLFQFMDDFRRNTRIENEKLKAKDIQGELGIIGGAVMCLVFKSRVSTKDMDREDIKFLLNHLNIAEKKEALEIISKYYFKNTIPAKTQFIVEELIDEIKNSENKEEKKGIKI